jgi:hypothetical protein
MARIMRARGRGVEVAQEPSKLSETGSIPAARFKRTGKNVRSRQARTDFTGGRVA